MAKYLIFGVLGLALAVAGTKSYLERNDDKLPTTIARAGDPAARQSSAADPDANVLNPTPEPSAQVETRLKPNGLITPPALLLAQAGAAGSGESPLLQLIPRIPGALVPDSALSPPAPLEITPRQDTTREAAKIVVDPPAAIPAAQDIAKPIETFVPATRPDEPPLDPRLAPLIDPRVAPAAAKTTVAKKQGSGYLPLDQPIGQQPTSPNTGSIPLNPPNWNPNDGQVGSEGLSAWQKDRNPQQVKVDSQRSDTLLRMAQLAYQNPQMPERQKIAGKEMALEDLFYLTQDPKRRFDLIRAYWKLAVAMSEYHWALDEFGNISPLERYGAGTTSPGHKYIEAVMYSSLARVTESKAAAITAQYELLVLMGNSARIAPLAVDVPLVGTYNTQFAQNFPDNRAAPQRLRAIDKTIDLQRDTVNTRAIAIGNTYTAWQIAMEQYQKSPNETQAQVVALAFEQLARHRRAFLASVREYNIDIAENAMMTVPRSFRPADVAKLLNRQPTRALWNTQAAAESDREAERLLAANDARGDEGVVQATFSEEAGERWSRQPELKSVMKKNE